MPEERLPKMASVPFQIDPKQFDLGNPILNGVLRSVIKRVNAADLDHDGIPDVQEYHDLVAKLMPLFIVLSEIIDFKALAEQLIDNPVVKDKEAFREALTEFGSIADELHKDASK